MNENAPHITVEEGCGVVRPFLKNIVSARWDEKSFTTVDVFILLVCAALEVRDQSSHDIRFSPHIIAWGDSGVGKTLRFKILFPEEYAALLANDSTGVGQISLRIGQNCVKIDDADLNFFNNEQLVGTVKGTYHSAWSAKTHGARQDNNATITVIMTNLRKPVDRMGIA